MAETLLVIEDEPLLGAELKSEFLDAGWDAVLAPTLAQAERLLLGGNLEPLVVISDKNLPDGNALDLLERVRAKGLPGEWVFLTAYGDVPESVRALKLGAFDFLEKPCDLDRLHLVVAGASRSASAQRRLRDERCARGSRYGLAAFAGRSPAAREVRDMLGRLSRVPFSSLVISGETGTGKGLAARILHHAGPRAAGPLIEVNCAALPRELMESELFGHEAGAFTGARGRRRGLIEQANGGTLFLDEISELEMDLQAKLLKVIEDRRVRRVGGEREREVDVQVTVATNRDLHQLVADGGFRADLYHRLAVFLLKIPTLRARKEDLDDLLPIFIREFNSRSGQRVERVPQAVWRRLAAYHWPGNVRELRNLVERGVLLADGPEFPERWLHLDEALSDADAPGGASVDGECLCLPLDGSIGLDGMERRILTEALARNGNNVSLTARMLDTSRERLRYRVKRYGIKTGD